MATAFGLPGISVGLGVDTSGFSNGLRQAERQIQQTAGVVTRSANVMRGSFANVGFQIQDMIVGLQSGQRALTVFIQQGTQIASAFGPVGIAIGVVGAAATALVSALFNFKDAADAAKAANDALEGSFVRSGATIDGLIKKYAEMTQAQRATQALGLQEQSRAAAKEIEKLDQQFSDLVARVGSIGGVAFNPLVSAAKAFQAGALTVEQFNQALARTAETSDDVRFGEASKEATGLTLALQEQQAIMAGVAQATDVLSGRYDGLAAGQKRLNATIKASLDLFEQVAQDRRRAAGEAQRAAEQAARQATQFQRGKIEQENRQLGDIAEQTIRRGNQARLQAAKAQEAGFAREVEATLALQAKAAEQAAKQYEQITATALDDIQDPGGTFAITMQEIYK